MAVPAAPPALAQQRSANRRPVSIATGRASVAAGSDSSSVAEVAFIARGGFLIRRLWRLMIAPLSLPRGPSGVMGRKTRALAARPFPV